ncbi:MAG: SLBB domain-containing protein [bacterium]
MKTMIPVMMAAGLMSCAHVAPPQIIKPAQLASEAALATNAIPAEMLPADCFLPYSPSDYKLAIGDVVEVAVFGFSDTIASLPIAPDGKLYYMFGDGVPAAGLKPEVVAGIIQGRLTKLFNNPRVTILPKSFASTKYLVLGKVQYPGTFPLDSAITLQQAIANAGGLAQGIYRGTTIELASLRDSYLIRDGKRLHVNFEALMNKQDPAFNIYIRPGDVIYIASGLGSSREVYLLGEVAEQKTIGYRDNMTLIELLAGSSDRAGGYTDEANLRRVVILRGALNNPQTFEVNVSRILNGREPDVYLMPGDLIYVNSKPFRFARDLARTIVLTFVRSFSAEAGGRFVEESIFNTVTPTVTVSPGSGSTSVPIDQTPPDTPPK